MVDGNITGRRAAGNSSVVRSDRLPAALAKMLAYANCRDRLILLLLAELGLSQADLLRVSPSTVSLYRGVFHSLDGDIPVSDISPATWVELSRWVKAGRDLHLSRGTIYYATRTAAERAGVIITAAQLSRFGKMNRAAKLELLRDSPIVNTSDERNPGEPSLCQLKGT